MCWDHAMEETENCRDHGRANVIAHEAPEPFRLDGNDLTDVGTHDVRNAQPEAFSVEGAGQEIQVSKKKKINKAKQAKELRNSGQEYVGVKTKKIVTAKKIKGRCNGEKCRVMGKACEQISDELRQIIFDPYHGLGDLIRQRLFLIRHVDIITKKKTTKIGNSRRQFSRVYHFTVNNRKLIVCKYFFLNTLGIPERSLRTALEKVNETGVMEGEKRGGRRRPLECLEREKQNRVNIANHIDRYP
ncbi:unnamed protein product, partial [Callosobruchus maculatus]